MATGTTKMAQMLDPEVLAPMIDGEVGKAIIQVLFLFRKWYNV